MLDEDLQAFVVEAQAIDQRMRLRQPKQARLGVSGLRLWRHRADLDEAEAHRTEAIDATAALVEACRQADAIGKDLYDAVILAEAISIPAGIVRATFMTELTLGPRILKRLNREAILKLQIEWDDFIKECPDVAGTADVWKQRLANALGPLFAELES